MLTPLCPARRFGLFTWALATLGLLTKTISAQVPTSVYGMAYATIDEKTLYIQGGINLPANGPFELTNQFYSLDLTQNWDTSNPLWKALTPPINPTNVGNLSRHSMTVSPNRQTLTTWNLYLTSTIANYSIVDNAWTEVPFPTGPQARGSGLHAATDPTTGSVFIPILSASINKMVRFSFLSETSSLMDVPPTLVTAQDSYSFAWCQPRKTFILFSGNATTAVPFFEYNPASNKWMAMPSSGATPSFRHRSCMIPAYNGTKMILFGGDDGIGPSVGSISILDVASMKWTSGNDAPAPEARSEMACSAAGDNFVAWGGYKVQNAIPIVSVSTVPLVYNLKTKQWTDKFVRIPNGNMTDGGAGSGAENGGGDKGAGGGGVVGDGGFSNNVAAIGGGASGGMVVIVAVAILVIRRRRQHKEMRKFGVALKKPVISSMDNPSTRPGDCTKGKPKQEQDRKMHSTNPQYSSRIQLQGSFSSLPPYAISTRSPSGIPSRSKSSGQGDPQDHIQQLQHQQSHGVYTPRRHSNHPQFKPTEVQTLPSPTARAPHGVADPITASTNKVP
ncbi:hypothetical protein F5H01DRAFT_363211 [Linnemannia elongata]|nr:hypothetical protein F5H01DRAFT_363211 [Linnemannia elongata]